jgi:hypothetical protein
MQAFARWNATGMVVQLMTANKKRTAVKMRALQKTGNKAVPRKHRKKIGAKTLHILSHTRLTLTKLPFT